MTKARAGKKGRPAPSPAAGVGAAYEFRADAAAVADLLDLDASAADHMPPSRGRKAPATSVRLEAARLRAVRALGDDFRVRCAALGPKTFAYFENWLWAARAEMADAPVVSVLPLLARGSPAQVDLARKLEHRGLSAAAASAACEALQAHAARLSASLAALAAAPSAASGGAAVRVTQAGGSHAGGGRRLTLSVEAAASAEEGGGGGVAGGAVGGAARVVIGEAQLHKLWALYRARAQARPAPRKKRKRAAAAAAASAVEQQGQGQGQGQGAVAVPELPAAEGGAAEGGAAEGGAAEGGAAEGAVPGAPFFAAAFCVCARLLSLQGGSEMAGGMQAACPPAVFDVLRQDLGVSSELFASPLNCRFPRFCSAALDADAPFGSLGSFFDCDLRSGAYLANPPFDPTVVERMIIRMEALLDAADQAAASLSFVVVMPRWQMPRGPHLAVWRRVHDSPHATVQIVLPKARHSYLEVGLTRPSPSRHDSSVVVLQSAAAARSSPVSEPMLARLREAFRAGRGEA